MFPFYQLFSKEIYRFMSIWVQTVIGPVSTAILYQLIFGYQLSKIPTGIEGVSYAAFLIPGLVMMQMLLNSFANGSSSLIQAKYTGNIIYILMAPISTLELYGAYLLSSIVRGIIVGFAVLAGIIWFGGALPKCWWAILYFVIFGTSITAGLGIIAGILSEKFDQLAGFQSFVMVPLIYLAGIFFNLNNFSGVWKTIAMFDPFLYVVDGFRYGFIQHVTYNIVHGVILVFVFAALVNTVGFTLLYKGIKIKH